MAFDISTLLSSELHSIKNQMQALLSAQLDLADALSDRPEYAKQINLCQRNGQLLNHKMEELLSILKIQNSAFQPQIDECWLCDTLALVIQDLGVLLGKQTRIHLDFDQDLNGFYDEQLLSIAIHNALMNAISAGAQEIHIEIEELAHGSLNIFIMDNGRGFKEEQIELQDFSLHGAGSGLGLHLMDQAIAAHIRQVDGNTVHGTLTISNHSQGGGKVTLFVP